MLVETARPSIQIGVPEHTRSVVPPSIAASLDIENYTTPPRQTLEQLALPDGVVSSQTGVKKNGILYEHLADSIHLMPREIQEIMSVRFGLTEDKQTHTLAETIAITGYNLSALTRAQDRTINILTYIYGDHDVSLPKPYKLWLEKCGDTLIPYEKFVEQFGNKGDRMHTQKRFVVDEQFLTHWRELPEKLRMVMELVVIGKDGKKYTTTEAGNVMSLKPKMVMKYKHEGFHLLARMNGDTTAVIRPIQEQWLDRCKKDGFISFENWLKTRGVIYEKKGYDKRMHRSVIKIDDTLLDFEGALPIKHQYVLRELYTTANGYQSMAMVAERLGTTRDVIKKLHRETRNILLYMHGYSNGKITPQYRRWLDTCVKTGFITYEKFEEQRVELSKMKKEKPKIISSRRIEKVPKHTVDLSRWHELPIAMRNVIGMTHGFIDEKALSLVEVGAILNMDSKKITSLQKIAYRVLRYLNGETNVRLQAIYKRWIDSSKDIPLISFELFVQREKNERKATTNRHAQLASPTRYVDYTDPASAYDADVANLPKLEKKERDRKNSELIGRVVKDRRIEFDKKTNRKIVTLTPDAIEARKEILEINQLLVISQVRKFLGQGIPYIQLINVANIGFMRGIELYDPQKKKALSTYSVHWIRQAIHKEIEKYKSTIRSSLNMQQWVKDVAYHTSTLEQTLGRSPTEMEIADDMGIKLSTYQAKMSRKIHITSLDAPVVNDTERGNLIDFVPDTRIEKVESVVINNQMMQEVSTLLDLLTPREAKILRMRFGLHGEVPQTQEQVGNRLGVTDNRIQQIEQVALEKLRNRLQT